MQVAQPDALLGQRPVKRDQQRLVVGTDRPDRESLAVSRHLGPDVVGRVRDGSRAAAARRSASAGLCRTTRASSAIDTRRRRQQRVDVDLADPALIGDEIAEPHQHRREPVEVHGGPAADTPQRPRDPGLVDQPARQRRRQRRQRQRPIAQHLDQLAAGTKHQDRAELAIDRAPDDQLVARAAIDHRLHRDARGRPPPRPSRRPTRGCLRTRARRPPRPPSPSFTPPTSVLCVMTRDQSLTATGKPMARAAAVASPSSRATRVGTTGMP